ncbi:MAG: tRNA (adenosine(37)-N6)-dimethylallyltransferase MiaA [Thermotogae bacterium]|nr:tRNA (adenosine(37)-N6)-dimethylallyltransferase MiaA [Thermotogota bacterium]MCL5032422.1 tRNA (adenosine(37)-N6)-dimethylallyltransferase MiaA [Thermotogota bacterium]
MKIPLIMGPTAVGKSDFAVKLAKIIDGEIISVDSMQIYKYMDIGTSKVDMETRKEIPHHMIDIVKPDEDFDVKQFRDETIKVIDEIISRNKYPILAGGTGFYFEALKYGIFEGPSKNKEIRESLLKIERESNGSLRKMLSKIDPVAFEKFDAGDLTRIVRAIEVYILTGRPISELWKERSEDERFTIFVLYRERNDLYRRINERVESMFDRGFVEEVQNLLKMGYSKDLKVMRSIGYKEVVQYLEGEIGINECVEMVKLATRHYAKRQLTWFRRYEDAVWINFSNGEEPSLNKVLKIIEWGAA